MLPKIRNYITENTGILIRIDDIAENMNWNLMKQTEDLFGSACSVINRLDYIRIGPAQ